MNVAINWAVLPLEDCRHSDRISTDLNMILHADTLQRRDVMDSVHHPAHVMMVLHKLNVYEMEQIFFFISQKVKRK